MRTQSPIFYSPMIVTVSYYTDFRYISMSVRLSVCMINCLCFYLSLYVNSFSYGQFVLVCVFFSEICEGESFRLECGPGATIKLGNLT